MGENLELGMRDLLRQLFGQNRGHDPILGAGEDKGGVVDDSLGRQTCQLGNFIPQDIGQF